MPWVNIDERVDRSRPEATYAEFKAWSDQEWARQEAGEQPTFGNYGDMASHFNTAVWKVSAWADRYRQHRMAHDKGWDAYMP